MIGATERRRLVRDMALDPSHPADRSAFAASTGCRHFLTINPFGKGSSFALVWAERRLGLSLRSDSLDTDPERPLWQVHRMAARSDGGMPLSPLSALSAIAGQAVDLELVFAADGSGSIDDGELRLQLRGYGNALVHPSVQDVIKLGSHGRIAVAYVEWGAPSSQHTIVDWTVIHDLASARAFGEALLAAPRAAVGYNSISEALAYSAGLIEGNDIDGA